MVVVHGGGHIHEASTLLLSRSVLPGADGGCPCCGGLIHEASILLLSRSVLPSGGGLVVVVHADAESFTRCPSFYSLGLFCLGLLVVVRAVADSFTRRLSFYSLGLFCLGLLVVVRAVADRFTRRPSFYPAFTRSAINVSGICTQSRL